MPRNEAMGDNARLLYLVSALQTAVPLWYRELGLPASLPSIFASGELDGLAHTLAERGDLVLFGPAKGTKEGETAEAFNALARGLTILSAVPGGVELFGLRWRGGRSEPIPARGKA